MKNPRISSRRKGRRNCVDELAVATMRWYFEEILSEQAIDGLRSVRPWVE